MQDEFRLAAIHAGGNACVRSLSEWTLKPGAGTVKIEPEPHGAEFWSPVEAR